MKALKTSELKEGMPVELYCLLDDGALRPRYQWLRGVIVRDSASTFWPWKVRLEDGRLKPFVESHENCRQI